MTTIAERDGVVAFDLRISEGGTIAPPGMCAERAVEIAIKVDKNSGEPVNTLRLDEIPAKRRK